MPQIQMIEYYLTLALIIAIWVVAILMAFWEADDILRLIDDLRSNGGRGGKRVKANLSSRLDKLKGKIKSLLKQPRRAPGRI
jgi:hypothetical protein